MSAPAPRREDGGAEPRPTRRAHSAGPRRWPTPARGAGLVLVVDDTSDTRELYALYFQSRGFSVVTAADGEAGVETALRYEPDVIVMDLAMPRLDGVAATQRLRQDARTRHTPIIILTGYQVHALPLGTSEAGADALLTKPCLPEDLERSVREFLPTEA